MKFVAGLGNPGDDYTKTRHNAGFRAVEFFAETVRFTKKWEHSISEKKHDLLIVKPMIFMNRSGIAVLELLSYFKYEPSEMLIVCDDFSIPLGTIRLRPNGSSGGHRGLQSIIDSIHSDNFSRLRIGVGPMPGSHDPARFVLEKMSDTDDQKLNEMAEKSAECIHYILQYGIDKAMNKYNKKSSD